MALTDRKYTIGLAYASGTADRTGATLDMSGFQEVDMVVTLAAVHNSATYTIKAQSDADSAFGSPQDIADSSITVAGTDDDKVKIIHIANPPERYVRIYCTKDGSNACAESVLYVQFSPDAKPTSQGTNVASESNIWPANGTA